ncbi:Uncharacterised protein [Serratia fonticola]|nr:Uncharacterised protein [Serratia fonticola]
MPLTLTLSHREREPIEFVDCLEQNRAFLVFIPYFPKQHNLIKKAVQLPRPTGEGWGEGQSRTD